MDKNEIRKDDRIFMINTTIMNAAIYSEFGGPIQVKRVPIPNLQEEESTSCIIQVMATGVCRSDWHGWKGHDDDIKRHGLPFTPGHEFSGIVIAIGKNVTRIKISDRVAVPFILSCGKCAECQLGKSTVCLDQNQPGFTMVRMQQYIFTEIYLQRCDLIYPDCCIIFILLALQHGSFAEYVKITRADLNLRVLPKKVSFIEAAALGCRFTTAYRAVIEQGLQWKESSASHRYVGGMSICVFGCGGLGLSCIMIAKAYKYEANIRNIVAVDVSIEALNKAKDLGANYVVSSQGLSHDEVVYQIMNLTNGLLCELTIDAAGFPSSCEQAVLCTRRGGRMIQVGLPIGGRPPEINMGLVAGRELELVGSHGFSADKLPDLLDLVAKGKLNVRKLVENEVTLVEGSRALMDMDKKSPLGMTVITQFHDRNSKM